MPFVLARSYGCRRTRIVSLNTGRRQHPHAATSMQTRNYSMVLCDRRSRRRIMRYLITSERQKCGPARRPWKPVRRNHAAVVCGLCLTSRIRPLTSRPPSHHPTSEKEIQGSMTSAMRGRSSQPSLWRPASRRCKSRFPCPGLVGRVRVVGLPRFGQT
ncbi:hypothetical protein B0I37DRAFT_129445 [Chaetomium sp. MPI-CAGE-AT-0009]|nr:hypothetical protein B0I37DRAFT_129445 [Chaetomium sp. MPI-CAGE-AT-0009]